MHRTLRRRAQKSAWLIARNRRKEPLADSALWWFSGDPGSSRAEPDTPFIAEINPEGPRSFRWMRKIEEIMRMFRWRKPPIGVIIASLMQPSSPQFAVALTIRIRAAAIGMCGLLGVASPLACADYDFSKMIQPVPVTAKFEDPGFIVWCGSLIRDDAGKCHLFYSRWPRQLGHYAWVTHSEVAHAVADQPAGPYRFAGVALPERGPAFWDGHCTHNPTVLKFGAKYYLYYTGNFGDRKPTKDLNWSHRNHQRIGVAVADHPDGPWTRMDQPLIDVSEGFHDALCLANPSVTRRPDGGYLMVYKAVGAKGKPPFGGPVVHVVATSDNPTGPFKKCPDPVFTKPGDAFAAEDPYLWQSHDRYWAIVKDFKGGFTGKGPSLALFESADGMRWAPAQHPLVSTLSLTWTDGQATPLAKLERPQLFFENGEPTLLLCAAAPKDNLEASFNVRIPLKGADAKPTGAAPATADPSASPAAAAPAPGSLLPGGAGGWKLAWSDEFDYPDAQLDARWTSQNSGSTHILSSRWRENAKVDHGTLKLVNKKERRGGNDWTSGNIWTKEKFQYGYFECRYRYAAAAGTNNSFWIMTTEKPPAGKKSFEIDINEGHYPNKVNTNIHNHSDSTVVNGKRTHPSSSKGFTFKDSRSLAGFSATDGAPDFSRDFHTFGLAWTARELVFYLDGRELRREKNTFCDSPAPVWLSLAIIPWGGKITDAIDGTFMEVDYVRIYQPVSKDQGA